MGINQKNDLEELGKKKKARKMDYNCYYCFYFTNFNFRK